jgi:hypothetical protein
LGEAVPGPRQAVPCRGVDYKDEEIRWRTCVSRPAISFCICNCVGFSFDFENILLDIVVVWGFHCDISIYAYSD